MNKKVDLKKDTFNKPQYLKTIDTEFKELGVTTISQDIQSQTSVAEFFELYNSLFYDIPAEGETNSHSYLVEQSGEYIGFEENNEEIEALRAEIATLRSELLSLQVGKVTDGIDSLQTGADTKELKDIQSQLKNITQEAANNAFALPADDISNI